MARSLTAAMQTALAAEEGYADVWLLELTSSASTLRFTSASEDQKWDGQTWTAVGGAMRFDNPGETDDLVGQSYRVSLGGVDQTVISSLLSNDYRGQASKLYFGQILVSTGVVVVDPIEVFTGLVNESWSVSEEPGRDGRAGTVKVSTTVVRELARFGQHIAVRTNVQSHRDMLDRAGLGVTDTFFKRVPGIVGKVIMWGGAPVRVGGGGRGGVGGDGGGGEDRVLLP